MVQLHVCKIINFFPWFRHHYVYQQSCVRNPWIVSFSWWKWGWLNLELCISNIAKNCGVGKWRVFQCLRKIQHSAQFTYLLNIDIVIAIFGDDNIVIYRNPTTDVDPPLLICACVGIVACFTVNCGLFKISLVTTRSLQVQEKSRAPSLAPFLVFLVAISLDLTF